MIMIGDLTISLCKEKRQMYKTSSNETASVSLNLYWGVGEEMLTV